MICRVAKNEWSIKSLNFLFLFFIPSYSLNASFTKTNSSWLIHKSVKVLEIKASMLFDLFFLTVAFYHDFSFFLLLIELIFTNLLVLLTHQFIFLYFFNEIISCFTYRFNLNSWVMIPSPTYYTWLKFPFILIAFNAIYLFHRHVFRNV